VNLDQLVALAERGRQMVKRPENTGDWYRVHNAAQDRAEVMIYGPIDDWDGVSAASFVADLKGITAKGIDLHINSPGGLVFDAIAIHAALKNHPAKVDVYVDGIAASAASFVAMAGDTVTIEKPAKMMIHDAGGLVIGNAADMRQMADLLDEVSDTIAGIYADRAGGTVATWRGAMRTETWYSAADAVKAGLADKVANDTPAAPEDRRSQLIRARARVALGGVKCAPSMT
jgi:ATP-dependent protease ClpP protease subunit